MSSRDIGPALPPHMRRSHVNTHEDKGSSSTSIFDEERNGHKQDERRRKYREKYDERERLRDKDRERSNRDNYRDRDRSSHCVSERDRSRCRDKRGGEERVKSGRERARSGRERIERRGKREREPAGSSKSSKRSKSDRTYNTDTEESSDESGCTNQEWPKLVESDNSDSETEDNSRKAGAGSSQNQQKDEVCSTKDFDSEDDDLIGPALPPQLLKGSSSSAKGLDSDSSISDDSSCIGPALPPYLKQEPHLEKNEKQDNIDTIGPCLPPHLNKTKEVEEQDDDTASDIGPLLPPQMLKMRSDHIGPAVPPHEKQGQESDIHSKLDSSVEGPALPLRLKKSSVLGPSLPPGIDLEKYNVNQGDASSDDEVVGPLLPEEMVRSGKNYIVQAQLERNAAAIKRKLEEKDLPDGGATKREEWMLALPPEGTVDLGLGPRSFRARGAPEKGADRSMWTDTPSDKARKEEEAKIRFELGISSTEEVKKAAIVKQTSSKDKSMEAAVKKHKRSKESLLEAHQKKLKDEKKKKEKAGVKQERRPFNRETDLKVNVFDDAQKKSIYKKAQLLDTRFSRGESKYL